LNDPSRTPALALLHGNTIAALTCQHTSAPVSIVVTLERRLRKALAWQLRNAPAMTDDALLPFVQKAKAHGIADESLVGVLRQNGWSERRIYRALSEYYAGALNVSIPSRPGSTENARDAFLYLLNFITLGFWTVALWQIWDDLVKRWFPDALSLPAYSSLREDIAWQIAIIVVTFPLFVVIHALIERELSRRPELYFSPIRRWLTYVALVLSAITIVIDAALMIQSWILGHLSAHFILDTVALLAIGGGVFAYYLLTIDPPKTKHASP
jgi:hypothetical protein